jgi:hypothetical protein
MAEGTIEIISELIPKHKSELNIPYRPKIHGWRWNGLTEGGCLAERTHFVATFSALP